MRAPCLRDLMLIGVLHTVTALMFHSSSVIDEWDTWAFVENGTFYAFYLVLQNGTWFADSFGVATSVDGTHFKDHGVVFTGRCLKPPCGKRPWQGGFWMGSGSIWKDINGRYVVNWSQDRAGTENISFAVSRDLIHWTGVDEVYSPDPRYYKTHASNGVRWDCIYSIPASTTASLRDGYPRLGYWTATTLGCGPYGLCNQTMGFGKTHDGLTWEALPSPVMQPPTVHWTEVGAVEYVPGPKSTNSSNGRYFALLGGNPANQAAEMIVYSAAQPGGPFIGARKNKVILPAAKSCYFARFFRGPNMELLVTHQSFSHVGRTFIAPYKAVDLDSEGTMRLVWWAKNEKLKGSQLPATTNSTGFFTPPVNVSVGAVFEATFHLPAARAPLLQWPGFLLSQQGAGATLVALDAAGRCVIANVTSAVTPTNPAVEFTWNREVDLWVSGAAVRVRLLYRRDMLELYVDDILLPVFLMPRGTGEVRLTNAKAPGVRRWNMSLPAISTPS